MASELTSPISQPIFQEPVFNEDIVSGDPAGFQQPHPSDDEVYKQIENLLLKDVVDFQKSRAKPEDVFKLEGALGSRGPSIVQQIANRGYTREAAIRPNKHHRTGNDRIACSYSPETSAIARK